MTTNSTAPQAELAKKPVDLLSLPNMEVNLETSHGFAIVQRIAGMLCMSTLVPKEYQGQNNLSNCIIALNMAYRLGADPLMVIQNLYVVHGRPGWSSQFLIATFNKCGRFSPIDYVFVGERGKDEWGCYAFAKELSSGKEFRGTTVTIAMSKAEKWGTKWQTMPEQMLRYRAASWFIRAYAPEIAMGLSTAEELRDSDIEMEREDNAFVLPPRGQSSSDLNAMLHAEVPTVEAEVMPEPEAPKAEAPPQPERKRPTPEELVSMRVDMVAEIENKGIDVAEIEKMVDCYSAKWTPAHVEKIRAKLLPNLLAELMGA